MNFYMINEQLDAQMKEIKQRITLSMNGVTSDSMIEKGVKYKKNYGVSIPVLREIAALYIPSTDLANRLWLLGWRETMLLSVFLEPIERMTIDKAIARIKSSNEKELIDCICLYLLNKLSFSPQLILALLAEENRNCDVAAFMLAARIYQQLNRAEIDLIIQKGIELSVTNDFELYKSIAICFGRFCRIDSLRAESLKQLAEVFLNDQISSQVAIATEVKQELEFLINL
ncbi:MAG: hypothetical protein KA206_07980 [Paludibacter sp.]|nr:hypothetical protein [Paludibacter sp.]